MPAGAHWEDVRTPLDVGRALQDAMRAIEEANPDTLYGIFGDARWTNKARLSDATLKNLIEHFSRTRFLRVVPEDELGNAYEYLIKQFADDSGHTAQEFYTNRTVGHADGADACAPAQARTVYDPTCGTGGMLISALHEVKRAGGEHRTLRLYGQERNHMTASIARMNLVLHGVEDFRLRAATRWSARLLPSATTYGPSKCCAGESAVLH